MTAEVHGTRDRQLVADVETLARRAGRRLGMGRARLSVVFVSNRQIHELNRRYRHRDRATDVLSFELPGQPAAGEPALLGEVYVSRDQARAQAREYRVSYASELRRLALHGILHLCGLTHRQMAPVAAAILD